MSLFNRKSNVVAEVANVEPIYFAVERIKEFSFMAPVTYFTVVDVNGAEALEPTDTGSRAMSFPTMTIAQNVAASMNSIAANGS